MSWQRLMAIAVKEFRQLGRDRMTFAMVIMIPLVQLLLFGFAINTNVRHIPAGVTNLSHGGTARLIIQAAQASGVVDIIHRYPTPQQARAAISAGQVRAVLVLPQDLTARIVRHQPVGQWLIDGSDSLVSSALLGLSKMPLAHLIPELGGERRQLKPTFTLSIFYNPARRTVVNIVPGLVGVILTMTMILFTSAAIVRERERGNLELLITTPVLSIELMLGKIVPYVFIGFIQVAIILSLGYWVFSVPVNGGLFALFVITLLFIAASLTLGLILSTIAQTQLQAMQMTIFVLLPSILLSGFMFPYEAMPSAAQWLAEALPVTHYMRLIRAVALRGATINQLTSDIYWLIGFSIIGLSFAAFRFKKRLD